VGRVSHVIRRITEPLSRAFGTDPTEDARDALAIIGSGLTEFLVSLGMKPGLGRKLVFLLGGTITKLIAGKAPLPPDARADLARFGDFLLREVADPTVEDVRETVKSMADLRDAIETGDWSAVKRALGIKSGMGEVKASFGEIASFGRRLFRGIKLPKLPRVGPRIVRVTAPPAKPEEKPEKRPAAGVIPTVTG